MEVREMLYLKACPRCKGAMHSNRDMYGSYRECLQCGHMIDMDKRSPLLSVPVAQAGKKVA